MLIEVDKIKYEVTTDNNCEVYGYVGRPTRVVIPAQVEADGKIYTVNSINAVAFRRCETLKSITIPNSVTELGYNSFYCCQKIYCWRCFQRWIERLEYSEPQNCDR